MKKSELRTSLAKVRGLGSAKSGTSHFVGQRLTALLLIPLTMWFVSSLMQIVVSPNPEAVAGWLSSGFNATALIMMLMALFYHAALGVQVIIEDYVHCPAYKIPMLLANVVLMFGFAAISILAVLKLHLHIFTQGVAG
jgi:succinate dehydrogenase / fumarate reductase membrane anchor subunit